MRRVSGGESLVRGWVRKTADAVAREVIGVKVATFKASFVLLKQLRSEEVRAGTCEGATEDVALGVALLFEDEALLV